MVEHLRFTSPVARVEDLPEGEFIIGELMRPRTRGFCREYRKKTGEKSLWGPLEYCVLVVRVEIGENHPVFTRGTYEYVVRIGHPMASRMLDEHLVLIVLESLTPEDRNLVRVDGERWGIASGFNPDHEGYAFSDAYPVTLRWPRRRTS
jgi:hypothetical protein